MVRDAADKVGEVQDDEKNGNALGRHHCDLVGLVGLTWMFLLRMIPGHLHQWGLYSRQCLKGNSLEDRCRGVNCYKCYSRVEECSARDKAGEKAGEKQ